MITIRLNTSPGVLDPLNPDDLEWWTPSLGPTGTLALPHLVRAGQGIGLLSVGTDVHVAPLVDLEQLAFQLGVKAPVLSRSIERMIRFGVILWADPSLRETELTVRRFLPHVERGRLAYAPEWWREAYIAATGFDRTTLSAVAR